jgi:hypothetical protein
VGCRQRWVQIVGSRGKEPPTVQLFCKHLNVDHHIMSVNVLLCTVASPMLHGDARQFQIQPDGFAVRTCGPVKETRSGDLHQFSC